MCLTHNSVALICTWGTCQRFASIKSKAKPLNFSSQFTVNRYMISAFPSVSLHLFPHFPHPPPAPPRCPTIVFHDGWRVSLARGLVSITRRKLALVVHFQAKNPQTCGKNATSKAQLFCEGLWVENFDLFQRVSQFAKLLYKSFFKEILT